MADKATGTGLVTKILLASDLSCRCDRALQRAALLARRWDATLTVVTALAEDFHEPSWRSKREAVIAEVRAELEEELAGRKLAWDIVVAPGEPQDIVIETAARLDSQFIITGVARNELLGRAKPGRTVEALVRHATAPVLVVKRRVRGEYRRILALTDFSAASEAAALRAATLFVEADLTLLHGYRVPFSGFMSEEANRKPLRVAAEAALEQTLARLAPHLADGQHVSGIVEYGSPEDLAADYIRARAPDLLVLGVSREGGRLAPGVVDWMLIGAPCDVLVVPLPAE